MAWRSVAQRSVAWRAVDVTRRTTRPETDGLLQHIFFFFFFSPLPAVSPSLGLGLSLKNAKNPPPLSSHRHPTHSGVCEGKRGGHGQGQGLLLLL